LIYPIQLDLNTNDDEICEINFGAYHSLVRVRESQGRFDYLVSWGWNHCGQCGQYKSEEKVKPGRLKSTPECRVLQISCGYNHSLMMTEDKRLFGCGGNEVY